MALRTERRYIKCFSTPIIGGFNRLSRQSMTRILFPHVERSKITNVLSPINIRLYMARTNFLTKEIVISRTKTRSVRKSGGR